MRVGKMHHAYMISSIAVCLLLCFAQVRGSALLILPCLAMFTMIMCWGAVQNKTMPLLLFFIPWSPVLRLSPDTFSFYTLSLMLICIIGVVKKWNHFKRYHLVAGILLLFLTLLSKLIDGSGLAMDYISFMLLIFLFPVVAYETKEGRYAFMDVVVYFSAGIILASLCAQELASYANMAKYIRVDQYHAVTRRCGFYGDPNFFVAQVTAALSGCMALLMKKNTRRNFWLLVALTMFLCYCGFLSGSKSFALVMGLMLLAWMVELVRMRGQAKLKASLLICTVVAIVYVSTSALFENLINVIMLRLMSATNLDTFTTGRPELWASYLKEIFTDVKVLLMGKGFTNVKINARASHSTLIQLIFQFGCLGAPILAGWCYSFFREHTYMCRWSQVEKMKVIMLVIGIFVPWLAIDGLFFDEFFMWQWFFALGVQAMMREEALPAESEAAAA